MPVDLARADLRESLVQGELRFQLCCGYVHALKDARILDDHYCSFIESQLREIWLELLRRFTNAAE